LRPPPIPLPLRDLVPPPSLFWHDSSLTRQVKTFLDEGRYYPV
jgi:hypothetical protein